MGRSLFRLMLAGLFAVLCVAVSMAVHMLAGGGSAVRPGVLVAMIALTAAGAFALARRQRSFGALLVACFTAQYGMHRVFSLTVIEPAPSHSAMPQMPVMTGHEHGAGLWQDVAMLLLHTLTAAVSAWWLAREESALATLLHLLSASAQSVWSRLSPSLAPVAVPDCARTPVPGPSVTATVRLLASALSRRGPPAWSPVSCPSA